MLHFIAIFSFLGYGSALQNPEVDPAAWERAKTFVAAINRNLTPGFERFTVSLEDPKVSIDNRGLPEVTFHVYTGTGATIMVAKNRFGQWEVGRASVSPHWPNRPSRLDDRPANLPGKAIDPGRHLSIVQDLFVSAGYVGEIEIADTIDWDDMSIRFDIRRLTKGIASAEFGGMEIDYETGQLLRFRGWETTPPAERPSYRLSLEHAEAVMLEELARRGMADRLVTLEVKPRAQWLPLGLSFYEFRWKFTVENATVAERQAWQEKREVFVYVACAYNGTQGSISDRSNL